MAINEFSGYGEVVRKIYMKCYTLPWNLWLASCLVKATNKNEIFIMLLKLTPKTPNLSQLHHSWVFIVNFEHSTLN